MQFLSALRFLCRVFPHIIFLKVFPLSFQDVVWQIEMMEIKQYDVHRLRTEYVVYVAVHKCIQNELKKLEMFILLFTHPMSKAINTRIICKGHRLRSHKLYFSKCFWDLDNAIDSSCTVPMSFSCLHSQFTAFYQIKENTLFLRLAAVQRTWLEDSYCKIPTNKTTTMKNHGRASFTSSVRLICSTKLLFWAERE